ncbi:uncharacterized short protein YbdD (DUF466 family) [Mycobacterium sp. OTB74]|nr:YbdD/YjiX family protein [Mycobacterium sp. OTB74]MDH6242832.1 uncharacterized short protein YbdD (DUF466 family) [Mycobacterium sp. OTB74]
MGRVTGFARQIRWYCSTLMGDNDFAHYLEHHERTHPDKPALSERDYWKARYRAAELNPQGRCC